MKRMISLVLAAAFFTCVISGLSAQNAMDAVIRDIVGTVEIKAAGSSDWTPAIPGQSLSGDTVISTGFRSTVLIALGDSLITVRPLTRLTLAELSRTSSDEKVALNLQTGRVRAEVKPQTGGRTDFTVKSSLATASVRGTDFEFDTVNLTVNEGTVAFAGASGIPVLVDAGGASRADERSGRTSAPEETLSQELRPDIPVGAAELPSSIGTDTVTSELSEGPTGDISVIVEF